MAIRQRIRAGRNKLVVYGNADTGYRLGAQASDKSISTFGQTFSKQGDAIQHGEAKFGQKATPAYPKKPDNDSGKKRKKASAAA